MSNSFIDGSRQIKRSSFLSLATTIIFTAHRKEYQSMHKYFSLHERCQRHVSLNVRCESCLCSYQIASRAFLATAVFAGKNQSSALFWGIWVYNPLFSQATKTSFYFIIFFHSSLQVEIWKGYRSVFLHRSQDRKLSTLSILPITTNDHDCFFIFFGPCL